MNSLPRTPNRREKIVNDDKIDMPEQMRVDKRFKTFVEYDHHSTVWKGLLKP